MLPVPDASRRGRLGSPPPHNSKPSEPAAPALPSIRTKGSLLSEINDHLRRRRRWPKEIALPSSRMTIRIQRWRPAGISAARHGGPFGQICRSQGRSGPPKRCAFAVTLQATNPAQATLTPTNGTSTEKSGAIPAARDSSGAPTAISSGANQDDRTAALPVFQLRPIIPAFPHPAFPNRSTHRTRLAPLGIPKAGR